jgi:hypothetical protein
MRASVTDVDKALDAVLIAADAYFTDLWSGRDSDEEQKKVLRAVALERNLSGLQDLKGLSRTLARLVHRDILEQKDGTYQFLVELVRRWILRFAEV